MCHYPAGNYVTSEQNTMATSDIFFMKKSTAFLKVEKYLVSKKIQFTTKL